jgi:hypothetical protein
MSFVIGGVILFAAWFILRISLVLAEIVPSADVSSDFYKLSGWMLRILLIAIAGTTAFFAGVLLLMGIAWGSGPSLDEWSFYLGIGSILAYSLAAIVLNFPGFPLHIHWKSFGPCQLLLLPVIVLLYAPAHTVNIAGVGGLLKIASVAGIYIFLWWLCLQDRSQSGEPTFEN